jgi:predicted ATPase
MKTFLKSIQIEGFKSIRSSTLELRPLNVLIGANGAGKSNFISFFKMLNHMMTDSLGLWIGKYGGANSVLHLGAKATSTIQARLEYETPESTNTYEFRLAYIPAGDSLLFTDEQVGVQYPTFPLKTYPLGVGQKESVLVSSTNIDEKAIAITRFVSKLLKQTRAFQFHDTSDTAYMKQTTGIADNVSLKSDGGNLAAILYNLKLNFPNHYSKIVRTIRLSAPFFNDFILEPTGNSIILRYAEFGSETAYGAYQLSDGTLRLIALLTLLLQPTKFLPNTILIDEPELGLHPHALETVLSVMRSVVGEKQIIIATQSVSIVDRLEPEDIIVAQRHGSETQFSRLDATKLESWLEEYSLGELWEKNVLGGRPS